METSGILQFEFECVDFPAALSPHRGLRLGIQNKQQVEQDVPGTVRSAHFTYALTVKLGPTDVVFTGGYAQGTRDNRFIYLSWGEWTTGDAGEWKINSRIKILLNGIRRELIETALHNEKPIRARVRLTNDNGQPLAASLKPEYITWSV